MIAKPSPKPRRPRARYSRATSETPSDDVERDREFGRLSFTRNPSISSSVAQSLNGGPSKGESALPRCSLKANWRSLGAQGSLQARGAADSGDLAAFRAFPRETGTVVARILHPSGGENGNHHHHHGTGGAKAALHVAVRAGPRRPDPRHRARNDRARFRGFPEDPERRVPQADLDDR